VPSVDKKEPLENDTRVLGRLQDIKSVRYESIQFETRSELKRFFITKEVYQ
jgi:hypothetical protein